MCPCPCTCKTRTSLKRKVYTFLFKVYNYSMILTHLYWMFHTGTVTCSFFASQHLSVHYCLGAVLGPCLDFDWPVSWPSDQTYSWSLASSGLVGQKSSPSARALGHGHWSGQSSSAGYRGKTLFFLSIYVYVILLISVYFYYVFGSFHHFI